MNEIPLLTISIPTFNRAQYLKLNLEQLAREMASVDKGLVEVLVSDNGSADETPEVVASVQKAGLDIRYVRNPVDIGSDANIAQCFNLARGRYVVIMGDDDLFADGMLAPVLEQLGKRDFGVVCLRSFGYENDPVAEFPGGGGEAKVFDDSGRFLATIGPLISFISACIINKSLLPNTDANQFCGGNLVQVHLVLRAALAARTNLYITNYVLACKRNNSGGYDFSRVFVEEFGRILDLHRPFGLNDAAIAAIETNMLTWYHPFYLWRQRLANIGDIRATYGRFKKRFGRRWLFRLWVAPILLLPRPLALVWGGGVTTAGRVIRGDARRGAAFVWNRIRARR